MYNIAYQKNKDSSYIHNNSISCIFKYTLELKKIKYTGGKKTFSVNILLCYVYLNDKYLIRHTDIQW